MPLLGVIASHDTLGPSGAHGLVEPKSSQSKGQKMWIYNINYEFQRASRKE